MMPVPLQYTGVRLRTTFLAQTMRGSHRGWYLVNSELPLTMRLPPTNTMRDQLKLPPWMIDVVAGNTVLAASIDWPLTTLPLATSVAMSVRSDLAMLMAPSTFNRPAPCCSRLAPGTGCAL